MSTPRRTRDPRIWWQYACWCIQWWLRTHEPILPARLRNWAYKHYGSQRFFAQPQTAGMVISGVLFPAPLPWPWCQNAIGPFSGPWRQVMRWFRNQTGGRSHRCEFTDKEHGALYGHDEGAFMDAYWDVLLERIGADE